MFAIPTPIVLIGSGNEDIHKSFDEFKFLSDPSSDYGVSNPWEIDVNCYGLSSTFILNESFSFLHVAKTTINHRRVLNSAKPISDCGVTLYYLDTKTSYNLL